MVVSSDAVIMERLREAKKQNNAQMTLFSLGLYPPLAGITYLLVNRGIALMAMAS